MSQNPACRFSQDIQYSVTAFSRNPSPSIRRGSVRFISTPTSGIATSEPSPRGAMA